MAHVLDVRSFTNFISKRERVSMNEKSNAKLPHQSLRRKSFRGLYEVHNRAVAG
jgi:hypothetical protein